MAASMTPRQALAQLLRSSDFQRLEADLARVSAFHILGIDRRELSHAALLGWLLGPREGHRLGPTPLRSFLMLVSRLAQGGDDPDAVDIDAVDIDGMDLHSAQVSLEQAVTIPGTGRTRRLDITVSVPEGDAFRVVLVVEYKVDAAETEDQTLACAAWAKAETQRRGWPTEPLMVYLCPGQGQPSSERFTVMDYDVYLPWLEGLQQGQISARVDFLLSEFRACLAQRDDVQDDQREQLRQAVLSSESDAIEVLRRVSASSLRDLRGAVQRHREALAQLGLFRSAQSKGHSAFVVAFREALREALPPDVWHVAGGEGSLVAIYLPAVELFRDVTGHQCGMTSALRLHLFMERPRKEKARVVLEVVGNHPSLDPVESKELRLRLAQELRATFADQFDQSTRGQIIGAYVLKAPGIVGLGDDVKTRIVDLADQFSDYAARVTALGEALRPWLPTFREALTPPPTS